MRKPWNLPELPVYSLATSNEGVVNMNICTYVTAVSMEPKIMMVAVYEQTKTLENILTADTAVLQILHKDQASLVRTLGKKSGITYNKYLYLKKKDMLSEWKNFTVLKDACAYMELEKISFLKTGDHTSYFFKVKNAVSRRQEVLTTQDLRNLAIIS
ncbi:MAG: flavin reductase [Saprospiraceae bacterium]|nr:flavin reductase [Saprospiraceae bacterium]